MNARYRRLARHKWLCLISALTSFATACMANEPIPTAAYDPTKDRVLHYQTVVPGPLYQRYQIDLYEDGTVIYTGLANVKSLGPHKLTANPEHIKKIVQAVWTREKPAGNQAQPSEAPVHIYSDATRAGLDGFAYTSIDLPAWMLLVRNERQTRTFIRWSTSGPYDKWFRQLLEAAVSTKSLRCPFLLDENHRISARRVLMKGSDLCDFRDEQDRNTSDLQSK